MYREDAIKAAEEAQLSNMEEARKVLAESLSQSRPKSVVPSRKGDRTSASAALTAPKAAERPASALA